MAESEVSGETTCASVLYKFGGNSSKNDLDIEEYSKDISSPENQVPANENMVSDELTFTCGDLHPNNNVNSGDGPVDCLNEGGCVSNTSVTNKVSSCGLETDAPERKDIKTEIDYKLGKKLIVKLEAPTFSTKLNSMINTNSLDIKSDVKDKSVSFSDIVDVNNGVVKKKRKYKQDATSKSDIKRSQQRMSSSRGRPPKKPAIATYHSQISGDKNTIKIRIRKAHLGSQVLHHFIF